MSTPSDAEWVCRIGNKVRGPFSTSKIRDFIRLGRLAPETMVCQSGTTNWTRIRSLQIFADIVPASSAPAAKTSVEETADARFLKSQETDDQFEAEASSDPAFDDWVMSRDEWLTLRSWRWHARFIAVLIVVLAVLGTLTTLSTILVVAATGPNWAGVGMVSIYALPTAYLFILWTLFRTAKQAVGRICDGQSSLKTHLIDYAARISRFYLSLEIGCGSVLFAFACFVLVVIIQTIGQAQVPATPHEFRQ